MRYMLLIHQGDAPAQRLVRAKRKIKAAGIPFGCLPTTFCPIGSSPCSRSST